MVRAIWRQYFKLVGGTLAIAFGLGAVAAPAATLTINGGKADVLDKDFNPNNSGGAAVGDATTAFTGSTGNIGGGLYVTGKSKVTYTYVGYEAGATNTFLETTMDQSLNNKSDSSGTAFSTIIGTGYVPFKFITSGLGLLDESIVNGGTSGFNLFGLAFGKISADGRSVLAFFDDGRTVDTDYDDMIVRIDVSPVPVPLPAAGLLLAGGLGGLAALRRRKLA